MTPAHPHRGPATALAAARIAVGVLVVAVLAASYAHARAAGRGSLVDLLGYFTNLTSLLTAALLVATGAVAVAGWPVPPWLTTARGVAAACLLVVAVVFHVASPGAGGAPAWVSVVLHAALPCLVVLDWLLVADRPALPWRRLWLVLPYPVLWLTLVLARRAADGWVPYGFLLPERGPLSLALHVAGILVVLLASAALVWAGSRTRGLVRPTPRLGRVDPVDRPRTTVPGA